MSKKFDFIGAFLVGFLFACISFIASLKCYKVENDCSQCAVISAWIDDVYGTDMSDNRHEEIWELRKRWKRDIHTIKEMRDAIHEIQNRKF